ncbi:TPA: phage tail assembly protein [Vibrio vulnificus]
MKTISTLTFFTRPTVALNTISVSEFKKLPHIEQEDTLDQKQLFEQGKAAILACSDVSTDEFTTLTVPDFNQLFNDISELITTRSDLAQGQALNGKSTSFTLLHPFENEVGEKVTKVKFSVPTVAHSEALAELDDQHEREVFMFEVITGLQRSDFDYLSINDYLALKPQVGAFFQQSAEYFRQRTLKA